MGSILGDGAKPADVFAITKWSILLLRRFPGEPFPGGRD
jgi:hypothetical protein